MFFEVTKTQIQKYDKKNKEYYLGNELKQSTDIKLEMQI